MSDKEQMAILRLREASEMSLSQYKMPLLVTSSGGKDSSVCVELARRAGIPFEVLHNHTTADAPETVYFVRREFARLDAMGVPCKVEYPRYKGERTSMWALIPQKLMPPTRVVRCTITADTNCLVFNPLFSFWVKIIFAFPASTFGIQTFLRLLAEVFLQTSKDDDNPVSGISRLIADCRIVGGLAGLNIAEHKSLNGEVIFFRIAAQVKNLIGYSAEVCRNTRVPVLYFFKILSIAVPKEEVKIGTLCREPRLMSILTVIDIYAHIHLDHERLPKARQNILKLLICHRHKFRIALSQKSCLFGELIFCRRNFLVN